MTTSAILRITDGTNKSVNLLNQRLGFHLESWRQTPLPTKGEGVYRSSPISDYRRLVDMRFDNTLDRFDLIVNGVEQDAVIYDISLLFTLLEKGRNYWVTDWQLEPVWLEARAGCETNTRHAHIMNWRLPELPNPYGGAFLEYITAMGDLTLLIEHTGWRENPPGITTPVALSAVETYDGRHLGNVDSTGARQETAAANAVFAATKRNTANLTHVWRYDNPVWYAGNLMDEPLPWPLLPAVPAVGDIIYFGIDTTLTDSGPFCSLAFDVGTAITNVISIIWEYWNGAAWAALTVIDNTNAGGAMTGVAFDTTGVNTVHWKPPSNWTTTTVNGVTGYWVRARVAAIGAGPTGPTQQSRDVYSVVWPYVEIQTKTVDGDIPALALHLYTNRSARGGWGSNPELTNTKIILALRSVTRGQNFTPYINCADEQNPTGITVTLVSGFASFVTDPDKPSGRFVSYSRAPGVAIEDIIFRITIGPSLTPEYQGEFRLFVRGRSSSAGLPAGHPLRIEVRGESGSAVILNTGYVYYPNLPQDYTVIDIGKVDFTKTFDTGAITFDFIGLNDVTFGSSYEFYDLVLIPVDEWAGEFSDTGFNQALVADDRLLGYHRVLHIDPLTRPKEGLVVKVYEGNEARATWASINNASSVLQANIRQRLFVFGHRYLTSATTNEVSEPWQVYAVQIRRDQRYFAMRGRR